MEHILSSQIHRHLEKYKLLSKHQHGFRMHHSCEGQLISVLHDMSKSIQYHYPVDSLFLDFSKAFDTVPHRRLMLKLEAYGVNGKVLEWINNFLVNRRQRTAVDGTVSEWGVVRSGVPQGTVLGPLLFLLFINDISDKNVVKSNMKLFADDSLVYRPIIGPRDTEMLQQDLDNLTKWSNTWLLKFNASKCVHVRFTTSLEKRAQVQNYSINGSNISRENSATYLGVTLSSDLKWDIHINNQCKKANSLLALLKRNLSGASRQAKLTAYRSLIRSRLEFASAATDPYYAKDVYSLEMAQRRAIRFVAGDYARRSSVTVMRQNLKLDTLAVRRRNHRVSTLQKILNNQLNVPNHPNPNFGHPAQPGARTKLTLGQFFPRTYQDIYHLPRDDNRRTELRESIIDAHTTWRKSFSGPDHRALERTILAEALP